MENQTLENAVDDISLIKGIITRTRKSFSGFSQIFIYWGILFASMSALQYFQGRNIARTMAFYNRYQFLILLIPLLIIIIATVIYQRVVRKQPLIGLERHLMILWILILFLQTMPTRVSFVDALNPDITHITTTVTTTNNFSIVVFGLGIALVMTAVLTELKHFYYLGGIYFALAIFYGYFYIGNLSESIGSLGTIILPFTLLYTGIYLKRFNERSESDGAQLDS